jgi:hypothetical protein
MVDKNVEVALGINCQVGSIESMVMKHGILSIVTANKISKMNFIYKKKTLSSFEAVHPFYLFHNAMEEEKQNEILESISATYETSDGAPIYSEEHLGPEPTEDDWKELPEVADTIPKAAFLVILVEFCERFTFCGLSGPFQNYIQNPMPPSCKIFITVIEKNNSLMTCSLIDPASHPGAMGRGIYKRSY